MQEASPQERVSMAHIRLSSYVNLGFFKARIRTQTAFEKNLRGLFVYLFLLLFYLLMQALRHEFDSRDYELNK